MSRLLRLMTADRVVQIRWRSVRRRVTSGRSSGGMTEYISIIPEVYSGLAEPSPPTAWLFDSLQLDRFRFHRHAQLVGAPDVAFRSSASPFPHHRLEFAGKLLRHGAELSLTGAPPQALRRHQSQASVEHRSRSLRLISSGCPCGTSPRKTRRGSTEASSVADARVEPSTG
jgi:hypothetical protein